MAQRLTDDELYETIGELQTWMANGQELLDRLTGELQERQPGVEVEARLVPRGSFFRKRTGEVQYMRISDSAAKHNMKDPTLVYGIAGHGNMAGVKPETKVVAIPPPNWKEDFEWRELMTELGLYEEPEEDK